MRDGVRARVGARAAARVRVRARPARRASRTHRVRVRVIGLGLRLGLGSCAARESYAQPESIRSCIPRVRLRDRDRGRVMHA